MIASKGKISVRQLVIIFVMLTISPSIRIFPQLTTQIAGKAAWLSPVVGVIPMIFLILIVSSFYKKNGSDNLGDIFCKVLGKIPGRIVCFIYLIWIIILTSLYIRYYAERILSSIMPHTSIVFLVSVMLIIEYYGLSGGLTPLARVNELIFIIYMVIFVLITILSLPQIKYENLMNVGYLDAWPVIKSSYATFTVWGYFIFVFFFSDEVNNKEKTKKYSIQGLICVFIIGVITLVLTVGALGAHIVPHIPLPFFIVVKNISILNSIDRMESILLALWVLSDFIIISFFVYISLSILKSIFKFKDTKSFICPILLITGVGSLAFFKSRFELENFSEYIALPTNFILEFCIPLIVYVIGKVRRII